MWPIPVCWVGQNQCLRRGIFYHRFSACRDILLGDGKISGPVIRTNGGPHRGVFFNCKDAQSITVKAGDKLNGYNFKLDSSPVSTVYGPSAISGYGEEPPSDETPCIVIDQDGNAHIVWAGAGNGTYLFYKMVDRNGKVLIEETKLNPCAAPDDAHVRRPSIALDSSGGLHIVFHGFQPVHKI